MNEIVSTIPLGIMRKGKSTLYVDIDDDIWYNVRGSGDVFFNNVLFASLVRYPDSDVLNEWFFDASDKFYSPSAGLNHRNGDCPTFICLGVAQ